MTRNLVFSFCTVLLFCTMVGCSSNLPTPPPPPESTSANSSYEKYVSLLKYQLGSKSWESYESIDPDALVVFYISLSSIGEREPITSGPVDDTYGNFLMPADDVEQTVQRYFAFDIPKEYIRKSQYYDATKNAYWTGGIGSAVDILITDVSSQDDITVITYHASINSSDYKSSSQNQVRLRLLSDGGFKYISLNVVVPTTGTKTVDIIDGRGNKVSLRHVDLYYRYYIKAQISGVLAQSWSQPSEIDAHYLTNFFEAQSNWNQTSWDSVEVYIPQELLEGYVKMYFDVTPEHIRQSKLSYIPEQEAYQIPMYSREYPCTITDATAEGSLLTIYYETYNALKADLPILRQGHVTIEVEDYPHLWKYLSNEITYDSTV